jgi:hypothetical protein
MKTRTLITILMLILCGADCFAGVSALLSSYGATAPTPTPTATPAPPTLVSATVDETGTALTLVFDEKVTHLDGAAFQLSDDLALTVANGDMSSTIVFSIEGIVAGSENLTVSYFPGSVASLNGTPLEEFTDFTVKNFSAVP